MAVFEYIGGGGGSSVAGFTSGAKLYVAFLTQTGTDAPVATVLQNDLGGEVVWTRANAGFYNGTLNGVFTANKTWSIITPIGIEGAVATIDRQSDNAILILTSSQDGYLLGSSIQIIVYP